MTKIRNIYTYKLYQKHLPIEISISCFYSTKLIN